MRERCCPFPLSFAPVPQFHYPSLFVGWSRSRRLSRWLLLFVCCPLFRPLFRFSVLAKLLGASPTLHTHNTLPPPLLFLESERESTTQTQRWEAGNKATTKLWEEGGKASVWQNVGRDGPISISIPHFILRRESAHGF